MKQFATIEDLNKAFIDEDWLAEPQVGVGNVVFTQTANTKTSLSEALAGKRAIAVYTCEGYPEHHQPQMAAFWIQEGGSVVPGGVVNLTGVKVIEPEKEIVVEMDGEKVTLRPDQLIGDIVTVKITSFSSPRELKGKVDTGATISSLHADNFKISGNTVSFTCQPLGPNAVTMPLKTQHAVKSPDGGTHYRPVIELNIKVNGKLLNNVLFNLNDRGNMDQPVLIGQNVLKQGKFYVDPTRNEEINIDWTELENLIEMKTPPTDVHEAIHEIYKQMLSSNVSFRDLVRHIKSEVIKTELEV